MAHSMRQRARSRVNMEPNTLESTPEHARKRKSNPEQWKRAKEKRERYSAKELPSYPTCNHRSHLQCRLLSMMDIKQFHTAYYKIPEKSKQDAFLLKYCRAEQPKRRRNKECGVKPKATTYHYTICNQAGVNLSVCRETFLSALNITKHRVIGVFKHFKKDGMLVPVETRGGPRKEKLMEKRLESVMSFITSLQAVESHYSRGKSARKYLSSELSISKLWRIYNDGRDAELQVKEAYFRHIFNTQFNLGFAAPGTDECSTCLELQQRIKFEKNEEERSTLMLKLSVHKKQAQNFFRHLKEKQDDCFLMSYDCQKNLVLPKVSDQSAYYSRQLYCYNLSVVIGTSKDKLNPENVSIYTWTENEAKKSSNEVASAVYNALKSNDFEGFATVKLVADGCAGQNKNINVLAMCTKWLTTSAPSNIDKVELIFPVTGHSFLPSDRVFGLIEKDLKRMTNIITPEEYHEVFRKYGTVKVIGQSWEPLDWKEQAKMFLKTATQLHFKISQSKRIILRRTKRGNVVVRGELGYYLDTGIERSITKAGKTSLIGSMTPSSIPIGVKVNQLKLADVGKLLAKHFGSEWKENPHLKWYSDIQSCGENDIENTVECECFENPCTEPDIICTEIQ